MTKDLNKNEVSILENLKISSFDSIYNQDEKELDKKRKYSKLCSGKKLQITAKVNDISARLIKVTDEFQLSLTDPTIDSAKLLVEKSMLEEEKKMNILIFNMLFPEDKLFTV
jgi:hypothetical protein